MVSLRATVIFVPTPPGTGCAGGDGWNLRFGELRESAIRTKELPRKPASVFGE